MVLCRFCANREKLNTQVLTLINTMWYEFSRLWRDFFDRINKINKIFFCFYPEHPVYLV
jgi:hypothetical protein